MKLRSKIANKDALRGAVLVAVIGCCFFAFPVGQQLRNLSYELPFLFRKAVTPQEALILYMDDESHQRLNQNTNFFQPWDRSIHTRLIDQLTPLHPKAIVFDILFDTPGQPEVDHKFVESIRRNGKAIVAEKIGPKIVAGEVIGSTLLTPFDKSLPAGIAENAGEDKMVRQHFRATEKTKLSLVERAAEITGVAHPKDPASPRWINYYGPPGSIPFVSYYEALSNSVPAARI